MAEYTVGSDHEEMQKETRRYYLSLKSTRVECNFGSRNCEECLRKQECKLYPYVR